MSVKISELPILDSLADNDVIAGVDTSANVTSKIEMATLKNYIDTNTQYTAGTNIDITNNVVSAPNVYNKTETNNLLNAKENISNKVTTLSSSSTNTQYPSAKVVYDELNNLETDLTNDINDLNDEVDNQIQELEEELKSVSTIYNAFPTESGEGEILTLDDTAEVKFKKFDLKGNTSQTTYSGKNFFEIKEPDYKGQDAWNGYGVDNVYTIIDNGFTFNARYCGIGWKFNNLIVGEQYTLSFDYEGNKTFWADVGVNEYAAHTEANASLKSYSVSTTKKREKFTFTAAATNRVAFNSGYTDNTTLTISNIQLESGSSATDFEPFVGGTPSPNPSYPQPVNVVSGDNEINVVGKNLWGNEEHGSINEQTGVDAYNENRWRTAGYIDVTPNTQYTLSSNASANIYYIFYYYDSSKTFISSQPVIGKESATGITPNNCYYMRCVIADTASIKTTQRQLEKGEQFTNYEPYQGNTYNIDLPVENLFEVTPTSSGVTSGITYNKVDENTFTITSSSDASSWARVDITLPNALMQNTSYTMKVNFTSTNTSITTIRFSFRKADGTEVSYQDLSSGGTTTFNTGLNIVTFIRIYVATATGITPSTITFTNLELEKGSKITGYSPYGTTPIELCKIGNYQDYFYKDSDKWYLHKEIGKVVLNGSENVGKIANGKFRALQSINFGEYGYGTSNQMYSNYFKNKADYGNYTTGEGYAWNYYIYFGLETSVTTTTDAQTWLTNNTPTFYGILATPTNTEITYQPLIDQLNLLEKAMSKDGQTNISQVSNDKPFVLDVTAIKSLQNVLDRIELLES